MEDVEIPLIQSNIQWRIPIQLNVPGIVLLSRTFVCAFNEHSCVKDRKIALKILTMLFGLSTASRFMITMVMTIMKSKQMMNRLTIMIAMRNKMMMMMWLKLGSLNCS